MKGTPTIQRFLFWSPDGLIKQTRKCVLALLLRGAAFIGASTVCRILNLTRSNMGIGKY